MRRGHAHRVRRRAGPKRTAMRRRRRKAPHRGYGKRMPGRSAASWPVRPALTSAIVLRSAAHREGPGARNCHRPRSHRGYCRRFAPRSLFALCRFPAPRNLFTRCCLLAPYRLPACRLACARAFSCFVFRRPHSCQFLRFLQFPLARLLPRFRHSHLLSHCPSNTGTTGPGTLCRRLRRPFLAPRPNAERPGTWWPDRGTKVPDPDRSRLPRSRHSTRGRSPPG